MVKEYNVMSLGKETVFRLLNGESVIGKLVTETPNSYVVERPYALHLFVMGETPFNGKEIITLKDWLRYSIDNHIVITKNNVLAQYTPDPDIIKLYHDKKEIDDHPEYQNTIGDNNPMDFGDLMELINEQQQQEENPNESLGLNIPISEEFLNDLLELMNVHVNNSDNINYTKEEDDDNFIDEDTDKLDDPDEWGNHYRHWPINPEDYL